MTEVAPNKGKEFLASLIGGMTVTLKRLLCVPQSFSNLVQRFAIWSIRNRLRDKMVIALIMASVASILATYAAMTSSPFFGNDPTTVMVLSVVDLVLLVLLGTVVTHRLYFIWKRKLRNAAGSRLQARMISVFTLLAVAPAMLVAMFAAAFFNFGVEAWFSSHVRTSLHESLEVAQAYLAEHKQVLRADAMLSLIHI